MGSLNDFSMVSDRCTRLLGFLLRPSGGCARCRHAGRKNKAQKGTGFCRQGRHLFRNYGLRSVPATDHGRNRCEVTSVLRGSVECCHITLVSFASTQCHAIIVVPCWKIANRHAEKWCCP